MRVSARADYALRAAIEMAAASDNHVTSEQLARAEIPGKSLETILTQLRRSNIVRSRRGPDGGFWLARPASEISLADVIQAVDGQFLGVRGEPPENVTYPGAAEPLRRCGSHCTLSGRPSWRPSRSRTSCAVSCGYLAIPRRGRRP